MSVAERIAALLRAVAILGLLLALSGAAGWPIVRAQDDEPTETPVPAPEGTLRILTAVCTVDAEPPAPVAILTDAELAEQPACAEGPPALVFVDDFDAFEAPSGTEVALAVGPHTLTDAGSGASRGVEIAEATTSTLAVTTFQVAPPTEPPTEVPAAEPVATEAAEPAVEAAAAAGFVTLVTHLCRQGIATTAELDAVDTWGQQLVACPVVVLEGDFGSVTEDAVTANDPANPMTYDQTVTYDDAGEVTNSLADGTFAQDSVCESDLAESLNGVDGDDRCYDQSGYAFPDIPAGPVTVASTDAPGEDPDEYTFVTAKTAPASVSDDEGAVESVDEDNATVAVDTGGDPAVTIHLFFAPEPVEGRVTIVGHLCPASIESRGDFNALGEVEDKLVACASITLPGDAAPAEGETAGEQAFAVTVQGADGVVQTIADLPFAPATVCERNLPASVDDDPSNDRCLDASGYVADEVVQGAIRVTATTPPAGARFVAAEIGSDPDAADAVITARGTTGLTRVDTTDDGDVVVHVFFAPVPVATATPTKTATKAPTNTPRPTRTPTRTATPAPGDPTATRTRVPTRTPVPTGTATPDGSGPGTNTPTRTPSPTRTPTDGGGTGSVTIIKRVCKGSESLSGINVLEPGQEAGRDDFGDATCQTANIQYAEIILADGSTRDAALPPEGVRMFPDIPATEGSRLHTFDDTRWGLRAEFKVEAGKQTVLISLTYEPPDDQIDPPPDIPEPNLDGDPPPLPPSVNDGGDPNFPEDEGVPDPVDDPAADPFGNIEDEPSAEEIAEEERAAAEVAKVDEGEDLPTVGTARATSGGTPRWLVLTGLALAGAGLLTGRRRRTGIV